MAWTTSLPAPGSRVINPSVGRRSGQGVLSFRVIDEETVWLFGHRSDVHLSNSASWWHAAFLTAQ
jgi:hypothetical protein